VKKGRVLALLIVCFLILGCVVAKARCEVTSCRTDNQGILVSCMEFASGKPIPVSLEKACTLGGTATNKWTKNPCPRAGTIGYCEVPRHDTITHVIYCYKKQGISDKQKLELCRQVCKGRFAVY